MSAAGPRKAQNMTHFLKQSSATKENTENQRRRANWNMLSSAGSGSGGAWKQKITKTTSPLIFAGTEDRNSILKLHSLAPTRLLAFEVQLTLHFHTASTAATKGALLLLPSYNSTTRGASAALPRAFPGGSASALWPQRTGLGNCIKANPLFPNCIYIRTSSMLQSSSFLLIAYSGWAHRVK